MYYFLSINGNGYFNNEQYVNVPEEKLRKLKEIFPEATKISHSHPWDNRDDSETSETCLICGREFYERPEVRINITIPNVKKQSNIYRRML